MRTCYTMFLLAVLCVACGGDDGGGGGGGDGHCDPGGGAFFRAQLAGGTTLTVDAGAADMGCGGASFGAGGSGFSMAFGSIATDVAGSEVSFIVSARDLGAGQTGSFMGDISVTRSASDDATYMGGMWNTPDNDCTLAITQHELTDSGAGGELYTVSGTGTCPSPLKVGIFGDADITMTGLVFSGVTAWTTQ